MTSSSAVHPQERVAKEEAEGQARAAASNRATQRVEASVMALRREQKQGAQSVLTMQNTLSDLQSAQLPSRLSDMEAEIAALKAKIAAQAQQQQQQQVPAPGRQVPAPAPPLAPFPGVAAAARPRPPAGPHPSNTAALGAASAPAAASAPQPTSAPASQPTRLISPRPPSLQQSLAAAPAFSMPSSQLSIPFQLLMPTVASPQLAPPHTSLLLRKQAMAPTVEKQPHAAAAPGTEHAQPSSAALEAAAKLREAVSAGSKPAIEATASQPDATARRFAANSSGMSSGLQANAMSMSALVESSGRPSAPSALAFGPPVIPNSFDEDMTGLGRRARQVNNSNTLNRCHLSVRQIRKECWFLYYPPTGFVNHGSFGNLWSSGLLKIVACVQEALQLFMCMNPVFVCGVCEVAFANEEGLLWHLNSTKHQDAVSLHLSNSECTSQPSSSSAISKGFTLCGANVLDELRLRFSSKAVVGCHISV